MKTDRDKFASQQEFVELMALMEDWKDGAEKIKTVFLEIKYRLQKKDDTIFNFKSRPGVSYSLRACLNNQNHEKKRLFALVDIIDDDPQNRWLSVCFYTEMVTDPEEIGNLVPEGILGDDGYCFDLYEFDPALIAYVRQRVDEAYQYITANHLAPSGKE